MSAKARNMLITAGIALAVAATVVWAANNVKTVKDVIG